MTPHDSRSVSHALEILRAAISDGNGRPLSACEKLACRVLLPVVGKRQLVQFCESVEGGNPMYRRGQLESALSIIERAVKLAALQ